MMKRIGKIIFCIILSVVLCNSAQSQPYKLMRYEGDTKVEGVGISNGYLQFIEDGDEKMRLTGGNFGIGILAPTSKLDVIGAVKIGITSSGDAFVVHTNSNVGIGTDVPLSLLNISSTDANNLLQIDDNGSGDPTPTIVDLNGNVGIGTNSTGAYELYVNGDANITGTITVGGITPGSDIDMGGYKIVNIGDNATDFDDSGGLTLNDILVVNGNTTLGSDTSDSITINADDITIANDTDVTLSGGINGLSFNANTLSIDAANGRVGIGTIAPSVALDVGGGSADLVDGADDVLIKDDLEVDDDVRIDGGSINLSVATEIDCGGILTIDATSSTSFNDEDITNVSEIDLDLVRADTADGSVTIELDDAAGADLLVGNNNALVVEGDNDRVGIGTDAPSVALDVGGGSADLVDGADDVLIKDDLEVDDDVRIDGGSINLSVATEIDCGGILTIDATSSTSFNDENITNVEEIDLDLIRADAADGSVTIELDDAAGADLLVGNNNALVVEGDNDKVGIGTDAPAVGLQIGTDTGSQSLTGITDVIIDGALEVDGTIYADGGITGTLTGTATNVADADFGDITVSGGAWSIDEQNSAFWLDKVSDETGSGLWMFNDAPTIATSLTTTDDDWIGLGSGAGRLEFDDLGTDEVNILSANVGIGTNAPVATLDIIGTTPLGIGTVVAGDVMVVASDGNIGIGTAAPLEILDVEGNIIADGVYADAGVSGVLTLGGVGGTNNENLTFDFDISNDFTEIGSDTNSTILFSDDFFLAFSRNQSARMDFETEGNNNFQFGVKVGNATNGSGYYSLMELDDMGHANRSPLALSANPVFRVYSADESVAADYIEMYHDQSEGIIANGIGNLRLDAESHISLDLGSGQGYVNFQNAETINMAIKTDQIVDEFAFGLADGSGNQLVVTNYNNISLDHDHSLQTDPTIFGHSDSNPDSGNNEYYGLAHTKTDFDITTGDQLGEKSAAIDCTADNTTETFTDVAHGMSDTDRIMIGGTAVPTGIDDAIAYYVVNKANDTFEVSASSGGAAVTFSDDGTAVQYYNWTGTARANDIRMFYNEDDMPDNVNGKSFRLYRRSAEGDNSIRQYIDNFRGAIIDSDSTVAFTIDSLSEIRLNPNAVGDVKLFSSSGSGENRYLRQSGWITAAGTRKYIQHQVSDTTDKYEITFEDGNVLGMTIDSSTFAIDTVNDRVGIGTDAPDNTLDIVGDIDASAGIFGSTLVSDNGVVLGNDGSQNGVIRPTVGGKDIYIKNNVQDTIIAVFKNSGNVGIGTTTPAYGLDIVSANGVGIGTTSSGADFVVDTTGNVGIWTTAPRSQLEIVTSSADKTALYLKAAASQTEKLLNVTDSSDNSIAFITAEGKVQSIKGVRTTANDWGDSFAGWAYGTYAPEHEITNDAGNFDATGNANGEKYFSDATNTPFLQADADNKNWLVIKSGTFKGAKAEIVEYLSTTGVLLHAPGTCWDEDLSGVDYSIYKAPQFITSSCFDTHIHTGTAGEFHVGNTLGAYIGTEAMVQVDSVIGADSSDVMHINHDADGHSDSDSIHILYDSGNLQSGDLNQVIQVSVDETGATSGEIDLIYLETTDATNATKHAIHVSTGFDDALTVSGAVAVNPGFGYENTSGAVVDRVNSGGGGNDAFINPAVNVELFDNDDDYILIGAASTFELIECILSVVTSKDIVPDFFYSKAGGNWTALIVDDGTQGFQSSGIVSFTAPGDWTEDDEDLDANAITNAYYVAIQRTYAPALSVKPTESFFKIYAESGGNSEFSIRGDGTIKPAYLADADAVNNSIYYSTTQSKLVFKAPDSTVHDLY